MNTVYIFYFHKCEFYDRWLESSSLISTTELGNVALGDVEK